MPKFPKRQADILALANAMLAGYFAHAPDFPSVGMIELFLAIKGYRNAKKAHVDALAVAQVATEAKGNALQSLSSLMKSYLKKSQVDVANDPQKLAFIGWDPKAPPSPADPPGQPRELNCLTQGKGSILLEWNHPISGGVMRNYIIQRRQQIDDTGRFGSWILAATPLKTEAKLMHQPKGVRLEYRVKATNIGGESTPSNTAAVVL